MAYHMTVKTFSASALLLSTQVFNYEWKSDEQFCVFKKYPVSSSRMCPNQ